MVFEVEGAVIGAMAGGAVIYSPTGVTWGGGLGNPENFPYLLTFWLPRGAIPGGLNGALIGSNHKTDRWEAFSIPATIPGGSGVRAGFAGGPSRRFS